MRRKVARLGRGAQEPVPARADGHEPAPMSERPVKTGKRAREDQRGCDETSGAEQSLHGQESTETEPRRLESEP